MFKRLIFILFAVAYILPASAEIKLPAILGNCMVLQQNSKVMLWGKANPFKIVKVRTSWDGILRKTKSDYLGNWSLFVYTPVAGGPYDIRISDGEELVLNDILIGEVWLCSGQSNMEMPVKGFNGQPVEGSHETIVEACKERPIRMFTVEHSFSRTECDDVIGVWKKHAPSSVADFSAAGYYFADFLQRNLDVPVGIVNSSWSASHILPWLSAESIKKLDWIDIETMYPDSITSVYNVPGIMYNAMINPLTNFSVKGILWYQGEADILEPERYKKMFKIWVEQNRKLFRNDSLPVYFVEIAGYSLPENMPIQRAVFKEAQLELFKEIDHVGIALTTDIGDSLFIHPKYKREVGERLAYWALSHTYGIEGFDYCGPVLSGYDYADGKIVMSFDYADNGLVPEIEDLQGFEVLDGNGSLLPVKAHIVRGTNKVEISFDDIFKPMEVRYCFKNYQKGNLMNNFGLPAAAFRIDLNHHLDS